MICHTLIPQRFAVQAILASYTILTSRLTSPALSVRLFFWLGRPSTKKHLTNPTKIGCPLVVTLVITFGDYSLVLDSLQIWTLFRFGQSRQACKRVCNRPPYGRDNLQSRQKFFEVPNLDGERIF